MKNYDINNCPICSINTKLYLRDKFREYWICNNCNFIYVPSNFHLIEEYEKGRYSLHQNYISDKGYVKFLYRIINSVKDSNIIGKFGLDFGSGPNPVLFELLIKEGFEMDKYDKYYYPELNYLNKNYDFITIVEVIEHLKNPIDNLIKLLNLLNKNGRIFIMTSLFDFKSDFNLWHYKSDLTHISFFSIKTFKYIAKKLNIDIQYLASGVIIISK